MQSGLCQIWSETPTTGFLTSRLIILIKMVNRGIAPTKTPYLQPATHYKNAYTYATGNENFQSKKMLFFLFDWGVHYTYMFA